MNADTTTELLMAAAHGDLDTLNYLLAAGAHADGDGNLHPICVATDAGQADSLRCLLEHGADLSACGGEALFLAVQNENTDCLHLLLAHGAHIGMSCPDSYWGSAFHAAAAMNCTGCLRLMLEYPSAEPNEETRANLLASALGAAVRYEHEETLRLLLQYGANPSRTNRMGRTAIQTAAQWGNTAALRLLLDATANAD